MKKTIVLILVLLIITNCKKVVNNDLEKYKIVPQYFTLSEIEDLNKIVSFFNSQICNNKDKSNCFEKYFNEYHKSLKEGVFENKISFYEQQKLYEKLNKSTFNKIWFFGESFKSENSKPIKSLTLKHESNYMLFLKDLAKQNNKINNYYESFLAANDISPVMDSDIIMNIKDYNIKDSRIKLVIAIHCLTLNDRRNRK